MPPPLRIQVLRGPEITPYLGELAHLRLTVFREWPYLYDGDLASERDYLALYAKSTTAIAVLAYADDRVVGVSTALGLEEEPESIQGALAAAGYAPESVLYSAESVLLAPYRGRGAGLSFFAEREAYARTLGRRYVAFCRVVRDPADPRRPVDAVELDDYWCHRGYTRHPELTAILAWQEIGESAASTKVM
jgi:GNAT superfamily N-acetyltransferase